MRDTDIFQDLQGCLLPEWDSLPDFGLYMDQLVTYVARSLPGLSGRLELTSHMINNYVKAGLIEKPVSKKYSRASLAQLLMISLMKLTTPLDAMTTLLHPADGTDTETIYSSFRKAQDRIVARISEKGAQAPLVYALESSSLQLMLRLMLEEDDAEKN